MMNNMKFYTPAFFMFILFFNATKLNAQNNYLAFAQVMPKPSGGIESIYKNITYPDLARKTGIQGKVYVLVFVNEQGGVDDAKVIKGLGAGCDEAAIEGIKKVKFDPGKNNGSPVKVKLSLAIEFKL